MTWKTVTVAHSRESKFFLSQLPVSGSQNLQPNRFMPRILRRVEGDHTRILYISTLHLNIKMNSIRRPKKTATLSIVLNMTTRERWRFGKNLTSLMILNSRNVLRTESPRPPSATP